MYFMNLAMGMDPIGFSEEALMWRYRNPVEITFGTGALNALPKLIDGRRYALVTYPDPWFTSLAARLRELCGDRCSRSATSHQTPICGCWRSRARASAKRHRPM